MTQGQFKTYQRGRRQYSVDTLFTNGMMFTGGAVGDGFVKTLVNYDIQKDGDSLMPRAGLRISELVLPDIVRENTSGDVEYHTNTDITLMASKDCIERGKSYKQYILGRPANEEHPEGKVWVCTSCDSDKIAVEKTPVATYIGLADYEGTSCGYLTVPVTEIHKVPVITENNIASIVGTFAFNNSFYFTKPGVGLAYTEMKEDSNKYTISDVKPKLIDPSEAVTFGYNMLSGKDAYSFINEPLAGTIQLTGILPYSTKEDNVLLMTPRHNEEIYLRCYFKGEVGKKYKFMWEWRNVGDDDWNTIQALSKSPEYTIKTPTGGGDYVILNDGTSDLEHLQVVFKAPTENVLVRVQAYSTSDLEVVEKAMTVGFDFGLESYGEATNIKQESYDLSTATGMEFWSNRLVLWGVEKDPTILFISDVNDPTYFPYPNNISVYDEPIVCVKAYLGSILVFTTNAVYQITLNSDGTSWNSTLVQSNLNISPWDRHLIQVVRNMVFFKSGDYYYMLVPKAQASTGKLALAPISSNIIEFFNYFEKNVADILYDTFDYSGLFTLVNFYNFLDYEDIHNVYVFTCESEEGHKHYIHLSLLYNINTRAWRIHVYEAPNYLFPFRQDATKRGVLASTSLLDIAREDSLAVQVFKGLEVGGVNRLTLSKNPVEFSNTTKINITIVDPDGFQYVNENLSKLKFDNNNYQLIYYNDTSPLQCAWGLDITDDTISNDIALYIESNETMKLIRGSVVTIKDSTTGDLVWGPANVLEKAGAIYAYDFKDVLIQEGTVIEYRDEQYTLVYDKSKLIYKPVDSDKFELKKYDTGLSEILFNEALNEPPVLTVYNQSDDLEESLIPGRCIQLFEFDSLSLEDNYIPEKTVLTYKLGDVSSVIKYDEEYLSSKLVDIFADISEKYLFKNWQFLDTGYRNNVLERNKRYRELQLQLHNTEGTNLEFGLEFQLDGESRLSHYVYETEHVVDANDPNYGLLYVQARPYMNLPLEYIATPPGAVLGDEENKTWILNQSLFPALALWKVRAPVSGKGIAPRMRLLSRNSKRFELMSINWVYRLMNAR